MPKREREGVVNFELGAERKARLEEFAARYGVTAADAVRHAIDRHLAFPPDPPPLTPLPPSPPPPSTPTGAAAPKRGRKPRACG